ncbi:MAG: GSCFA domain-containing protein [Opitutaceae bacterium]|nr:GSCFA domain-containing protein [Opitutaceae bacterium]
MKLGDLPKAARYFSKCVRLKPHSISFYRPYFQVLWSLQRRDELQGALDVLLHNNVKGPDADFLRGSWLYRLGRSREARSLLLCAISAAPNRGDLHLIFGMAALEDGDGDVGRMSLRSAIVLEPGAAGAYQSLGVSLEQSLDLPKARRILNLGLLLGNEQCAFPLTRVLKGLNRFEESVSVALNTGLDRLHFRSGVTVGSLDRSGIVDFDGYDFHGAAEIEAAELFEFPAPFAEKATADKKWHFQARAIDFFPRSVEDFTDLQNLVRDHVIARSVPDQPLFPLNSNVLTMGSCFAGHLRKRLIAKRKSTELISVPEGLNNTFALRQFIDWSLTGNVDSSAFWYDQHEDGGIEQWMPPAEQSFYREKFGTFDGFVITIGLSEIWRDRETGGVFWRGVPQAIFDDGRHTFQISSVEENTDNLLAIVELVRRHCGPKPVIFTLSPVPLIATHRTDVSCMLADSVSKSILRVAIDQVMRKRLENVYYWPAFEIVRWASGHAPYRAFGDDDGAPRHVNDSHVSAIIDAFIEHFFLED